MFGAARLASNPGRPNGTLAVGLIWGLLPHELGGTTTKDVVKGARAGVFNGAPTWGPGPRGPIIKFPATTDYLAAGTAAFLPTTANFSLVLSWKKNDTTKRNSNPFGELAGVIAQRCQAHLPYSDGTVYFDYGGATNGTTRVQAAGLTFGGDDIWVFTVGRRGMEIWQNGLLRASNTAQPTRTASSATWCINKGSSAGDLAQTSGVLVYERQLLPGEIAAVSTDIYAPFRPPKRRRAAKAAAAPGGSSPLLLRLHNERLFTGGFA